MIIRKVAVAIAVGGALSVGLLGAPAEAASVKSFKNCAALNKVYPHGVGKKGARDKTSGKPVTTFRVDNTLYSYNDGGARHWGEYDLDRDNDGIACEKR